MALAFTILFWLVSCLFATFDILSLFGKKDFHAKSKICPDMHVYICKELSVFSVCKTTFEPRCEKTGFLHMRKQRHRSASR